MAKTKKMDFIRMHMIASIRSKARDIKFKNTLQKKWNSFIWLIEPIECDGKKIDRINELFAFFEDEIVNIEWSSLAGSHLVKILTCLSDGKFK